MWASNHRPADLTPDEKKMIDGLPAIWMESSSSSAPTDDGGRTERTDCGVTYNRRIFWGDGTKFRATANVEMDGMEMEVETRKRFTERKNYGGQILRRAVTSLADTSPFWGEKLDNFQPSARTIHTPHAMQMVWRWRHTIVLFLARTLCPLPKSKIAKMGERKRDEPSKT